MVQDLQEIIDILEKISIIPVEIPPEEVEFGKEKIGEGVFSDVYKDKWKGQVVATKRIKKRHAEDCEIEILSKIDHPNVLKFHGTVSSSSSPYPALVFEYLAGLDLLDCMRNPENHLYITTHRVRIATEIARGLDYLHGKNIIHRDMKTENILLSADKKAVIADFGLAVQFTGEGYLSNQNVGGPHYAAPEVIKPTVILSDGVKKTLYTPKADVRALGAIIFTMWHFKVPYSHVRSERKILKCTLAGEYDVIPADTPKHISSLILNLWSLNPKDRYSAAEVIPRLIEPSSSSSSSTPDKSPKPERK